MANIFTAMCLSLVAVSCASAQLGAIGNIKVPLSQDDPDVVKIATIRPELEQQLGKKTTEFTVVSYGSQVVAGTNYFAKVKIAENEYVHVRVFVPLPYTQQPPKLSAYQTGKLLGDDITYFDAQELTTVKSLGASGTKDGTKASDASYIKFDFSIFALFFLTVAVLFA